MVSCLAIKNDKNVSRIMNFSMIPLSLVMNTVQKACVTCANVDDVLLVSKSLVLPGTLGRP